MSDFTQLMMRHGESGIQAIIEQIERIEGLPPRRLIALEQRWEELMRMQQQQTRWAA